MPIRLTIIVDKGVARIKTDWDKPNNNNIKDFCKLLLNLQHGQCQAEIAESVGLNSKKTGDYKIGDKIIKQLLAQENFMEMPIISPDEVGEDILNE